MRIRVCRYSSRFLIIKILNKFFNQNNWNYSNICIIKLIDNFFYYFHFIFNYTFWFNIFYRFWEKVLTILLLYSLILILYQFFHKKPPRGLGNEEIPIFSALYANSPHCTALSVSILKLAWPNLGSTKMENIEGFKKL